MVWLSLLWALGAVLLAFSVWATIVGLIGVLGGERIRRCRRCHRIGVTSHDVVHPFGCPAGLAQRYDLLHLAARSHHRLRHH